MAKLSAAAVGPPKEISTSQSPQVRDLSSIAMMEEKFEMGYDSDGEAGPFVDMEEIEGEQIFEEEAIEEYAEAFQEPESLFDGDLKEVEDNGDSQVEKEAVEVHVPIEDAVLDKMNCTTLKVELKKRGQKVMGKKADLLERLKKALVLIRRIPAHTCACAHIIF